MTTIDINGKALQVEILDTAGQAEYTPLRETFMHTGDGFLLIYSITDDQTLEDLREIREQILRVHPRSDVSNVLLRMILGRFTYLGCGRYTGAHGGGRKQTGQTEQSQSRVSRGGCCPG